MDKVRAIVANNIGIECAQQEFAYSIPWFQWMVRNEKMSFPYTVLNRRQYPDVSMLSSGTIYAEEKEPKYLLLGDRVLIIRILPENGRYPFLIRSLREHAYSEPILLKFRAADGITDLLKLLDLIQHTEQTSDTPSMPIGIWAYISKSTNIYNIATAECIDHSLGDLTSASFDAAMDLYHIHDEKGSKLMIRALYLYPYNRLSDENDVVSQLSGDNDVPLKDEGSISKILARLDE